MTRARAFLRKARWDKPGRLIVAPTPGGLKARAVRLTAGSVMEWHSTGAREEFLLVMEGRCMVEARVASSAARLRRLALSAGACAYLSRNVDHRVLQQGKDAVLYVYVTG